MHTWKHMSLCEFSTRLKPCIDRKLLDKTRWARPALKPKGRAAKLLEMNPPKTHVNDRIQNERQRAEIRPVRVQVLLLIHMRPYMGGLWVPGRCTGAL